ncbi:hypothetical protein NDU88_001883 [Pleurodeles waltl]|uniref:Uncharacterized protein n=1 Tax=Pleurodeles waltl TaxID=8319 RepID=A0AAV7T0H5_PLEWA|nr:hypothetical protein NDU88_001883 [Pleurodeles waltl]
MTAHTKKERTLKEMLSKPTDIKMGGESSPPEQEWPPDGNRREDQVIHPFLEALFTSLREDLQVVLSQDLKEVLHEVTELGDRVSSIEDRETACDEDIELLQQEDLRLRKQQIDLQAHAKELEN